jgi:3-dehydroquinate synthetase
VWLHGEAVAAGMVMAADMSHRLGWIERDVLQRATRLLQRAQLPTAPPKVRGGRPFCMLPSLHAGPTMRMQHASVVLQRLLCMGG